MVSIERIYQFIRDDKKNAGDLYKNCRHQMKQRKRPVGKHMFIKDRTSIDNRPPEAEQTRHGNREMYLIVGSDNKGPIVTLIERNTGFTMIRKLEKG